MVRIFFRLVKICIVRRFKCYEGPASREEEVSWCKLGARGGLFPQIIGIRYTSFLFLKGPLFGYQPKYRTAMGSHSLRAAHPCRGGVKSIILLYPNLPRF
jgi:hypothetical protein